MSLANVGVISAKRQKELFVAYATLVVAVFAVSSAATVFKKIDAAPPLLRAAWRLFGTSVLLGVGAAVQFRRADASFRLRYLGRSTGCVLLASGLALGVHFGTWVWSLDHTSLAHSLLLVSACPLIIAVVMRFQGTHLNRFELAGVLLGVGGVGVMMMDLRLDRDVSLAGDFAALVGAFAFVVYMFAGRRLRQWVPLFLYAFPVTLISSLFLFIVSLILERDRVTFVGTGSESLFGMWGTECGPWILYLAIVPGIFGHTGINAVLKTLPPLVVSIALTSEPFFGTLLGVLAGVASTPHVFTAVGGPMNLLGLVVTIYGTQRRESQDQLSQDVAASHSQAPAAEMDEVELRLTAAPPQPHADEDAVDEVGGDQTYVHSGSDARAGETTGTLQLQLASSSDSYRRHCHAPLVPLSRSDVADLRSGMHMDSPTDLDYESSSSCRGSRDQREARSGVGGWTGSEVEEAEAEALTALIAPKDTEV